MVGDEPFPDEELEQTATDAVTAAAACGLSLAVAESLTAGRLAWTLGRVAGSGDCFAGGIVTYSRAAKARLLDVDPGQVVDPDTAVTMAVHARALFDVDLCVSLTGVAGPQTQDAMPVGTVFLGWAAAGGSGVDEHHFAGDPEAIRRSACLAALDRLAELAEVAAGP